MKRFFFITLAMVLFISCTEEIDTSSRYVFIDKTITQYLESKDYYSDYVKLLSEVPVSDFSKTTLKQLLSARGHYTVFAPTNDAINIYLDTLCAQGLITEPSWDGFTSQRDKDSISRVIVFNSILDGGDQQAFDVMDFPDHEHEFGQANMNDRKLRVFYGTEDPDSISINGTVLVNKKNRGITLTNGYIHQVEAVIAPSNDRMGEFVVHWARTPKSGYSVMAKLVMACGLVDTLNAFRDDTWEYLYLTGGVKDLQKHNSNWVNITQTVKEFPRIMRKPFCGTQKLQNRDMEEPKIT